MGDSSVMISSNSTKKEKKQTMAFATEGTTMPKPEKPSSDDDGGAMCAAIALLVLAIIGLVHLVLDIWNISDYLLEKHDPVEYNLTITAVTGLDPANDLHARGLLNPAFNLTLLVASPRTAKYRECVTPGTTVEVSYLRSGVPLATGPAPTFCVDAGERREEASIVAWGDGVHLPEILLDSLAADMLRGAPEFGVKLIPVPPYCGQTFCFDTADVVSCWAKVGGGPAPCSVAKERVPLPPVPRRPRAVKDLAEANLPQPPTP